MVDRYSSSKILSSSNYSGSIGKPPSGSIRSSVWDQPTIAHSPSKMAQDNDTIIPGPSQTHRNQLLSCPLLLSACAPGLRCASAKADAKMASQRITAIYRVFEGQAASWDNVVHDSPSISKMDKACVELSRGKLMISNDAN